MPETAARREAHPQWRQRPRDWGPLSVQLKMLKENQEAQGAPQLH